jgi:(p)ppGpp synthase/HD superfamily hydrolase
MYAQTYIQLMNQLQTLQYPEAELFEVMKAYQLAMELFSGQYRPSGKTFLAHLIGTASILATLSVSLDLIVAGLLHAAYSYGDFGDGFSVLTFAKKRSYLRQAISDKRETLIFNYYQLNWYQLGAIAKIYDNLSQLDSSMVEVITVHLANELEDCLDNSLLYCHPSKYQATLQADSYLLAKIAEKFGYEQLAAELTTTFEKIKSTNIPLTLQSQFPAKSFTMPPKSFRKSWPAKSWEVVRKIKKRFLLL